MAAAARRGDAISGGIHCHGHDHGPRPTPGRIRDGARRVFFGGVPAARAGDHGFSSRCCAGVGDIVILPAQQKVFIERAPAARCGSPTLHCGMAPGRVAGGYRKIHLP